MSRVQIRSIKLAYRKLVSNGFIIEAQDLALSFPELCLEDC